MIKVISDPSQLTCDWLSEALVSTGTIQSRVTKVSLETIGEGVGLMAELTRMTLTYAEKENAPSTMIAKCAARNENRAVAQILDFYNRETNFYNKVSKTIPFPIPDSYFGAVNQDSYDCVILMEDLGNVSPNDQIVGSSEDEAFSAIERIADMHAIYWRKVGGPESSWMYDFMSTKEACKLQTMLYQPAIDSAIENFRDEITNEQIKLIRKVGEAYPQFWSENMHAPYTFIHGDYRQDNMIYPADGSDAIVMDWQISGKGLGVFDLTYFICQSLQPELRKKIDRKLVEHYVGRLKAKNIGNYSVGECWQDYRRLILGCLVYPVTVCGTLDLTNERGRALGSTMLTRNLSAIEELDCQELLP